MQITKSKTLTEKDKKLLVLLAVVVIIAGLGVSVYMPLSTKVSEAKIELAAAREEKERNALKISSLEATRTREAELRKSLEEERKDFYPMMNSQDIDKMLTNLALSYGLNICSINITMPTESSTTIADYYAILNGTVNPQAAEASKAPAAVDPATGEPIETESSTQDAGGIYVCDGICMAEIDFNLSGDQTKLQNILDKCTKMEPGLRVASFSWSNTSDQNGLTLSMGLELYMIQEN